MIFDDLLLCFVTEMCNTQTFTMKKNIDLNMDFFNFGKLRYVTVLHQYKHNYQYCFVIGVCFIL